MVVRSACSLLQNHLVRCISTWSTMLHIVLTGFIAFACLPHTAPLLSFCYSTASPDVNPSNNLPFVKPCVAVLQIIPPHDTGIAAAIEAQSELWTLPEDAASSPLVKDPLHMVTQRYYYSLQQELSFRPRQDNPKASPVVYTPLHGVGLPWLQKVPSHAFLNLPVAYVSLAACCLNRLLPFGNT